MDFNSLLCAYTKWISEIKEGRGYAVVMERKEKMHSFIFSKLFLNIV